MTSEKEQSRRAGFEKWCEKRGFDITRHSTDLNGNIRYKNGNQNKRWGAWNAALDSRSE